MEAPFFIRNISFNCNIADCDQTFQNKAELKQHHKEAHKLTGKRCLHRRCKHSFVCKSNLMQHIRTAHNDARWICGDCGYELRSYRSLRKHLYYHHQRGRFGCGVKDCSYIGLTRIAVCKHYRLVHHHHQPETTDEETSENNNASDNPSINYKFICTWLECKYRSVQRSNMVKHVRTVHLKLPRSVRMQMLQNIVDNREASDYFIKL